MIWIKNGQDQEFGQDHSYGSEQSETEPLDMFNPPL